MTATNAATGTRRACRRRARAGNTGPLARAGECHVAATAGCRGRRAARARVSRSGSCLPAPFSRGFVRLCRGAGDRTSAVARTAVTVAGLCRNRTGFATTQRVVTGGGYHTPTASAAGRSAGRTGVSRGDKAPLRRAAHCFRSPPPPAASLPPAPRPGAHARGGARRLPDLGYATTGHSCTAFSRTQVPPATLWGWGSWVAPGIRCFRSAPSARRRPTIGKPRPGWSTIGSWSARPPWCSRSGAPRMPDL